MSPVAIATLVIVWIIHLYLVVRCFRRGRWGYGLAGITFLAPLAWVGAFLQPREP